MEFFNIEISVDLVATKNEPQPITIKTITPNWEAIEERELDKERQKLKKYFQG